MQLLENIRLAFTSLLANKMRALLTMLGIIIGISAVIMITTIGSSIQKTLKNTFNSLGEFNLFYAGVIITSDDYVFSRDDFISREMLDELVETYPDYFSLSFSENVGQATARNYRGQTVTLDLNGLLDDSTKTMSDHLRGRVISYQDNMQLKNTIYVTDLFVRQYFPVGTDPIGQTVNLTLSTGVSADFVIVGVSKLTKAAEKEMGVNVREIDKVSPGAVPLDTVMNLMHQNTSISSVATIRYSLDYDAGMQMQVLQDFFDEKYAEKKGIQVYVQDMQQQLGIINTIISVVTVAISIIAAISLIVGGVGVMNIMLVSITERTKEIGVRKALGAQNSAIRMQFVVEAIMICLIGGIIGILFGIVGGLGIGWLAKLLVEQFYAEYAELISITIEPSIAAIIISVLFSVLTGVFFGYYPANKAAQMDPIDALRYD